MLKDYADKELNKIFNNPEYAFPLNVAIASIWIIANLKGSFLKVLDIGKKSALADYFVLANADNSVQAEAMADDISHFLKKFGLSVLSREGSRESGWILIDTGSVIIHIFQDSSRKLYDLDELWKTAPSIPIPESFYFQPSIANDQDENQDKERGMSERYF